MDQEKPFKTIEVVDSRTQQVCKVACMSCIRGHRTTSCGIPVCRTKVFWTVKRPGRPSNSCTCRYSATGGCKCVVAQSACPHKAKKGEKRSGECRCDEQGRYCCLLEPHHWDALHSLQKPTVTFHVSREALEDSQAALMPMHLPPTPANSTMSPAGSMGVPMTPTPLSNGYLAHTMPPHYPPTPNLGNGNGNGLQSPGSQLTTRMHSMGVGAPHDLGFAHSPDPFAWQGHTPLAPPEFSTLHLSELMQPVRSTCCGGSPAPTMHGTVLQPAMGETSELNFQSLPELRDLPMSRPYNDLAPQGVSAGPVSAMDRFTADYFNHQFPGAICQNCSLSGCTCRNCPPTLQNWGESNWGSGCGRKHARDAQSVVPVSKAARTENYDPTQSLRAQHGVEHASPGCCQPAVGLPAMDADFDQDYPSLQQLIQSQPDDLGAFQLDPDAFLPNGPGTAEFDEFLAGLDAPTQPNGDGHPVDEDEDEGGGCCCGGGS